MYKDGHLIKNWRHRLTETQILARDTTLKKTYFALEKDSRYPTFFINHSLNVIINLSPFPRNISFNDFLFHAIKGEICERLCFQLVILEKHKIKCKSHCEDCLPMKTANNLMAWLGFSAEHLYFNEYENEGLE